MQKKVAVAFFGIPRASNICVPSIEENILNPLKRMGAKVEVFFHLFEIDQISNKRSGEDGLLDQSNYEFFNKYDGELEGPEKCLDIWKYPDIEKRGDYWGDNFKSLKNLIHQLHSLHSVTLRLSKYDPDIAVFVRPDLLYHDKISEGCLNKCLENPDAAVLPNWQWYMGYNDRFSICGKNAIRAYGQRAENLVDFIQLSNGPLHAETFLEYSLRLNKIRVVTTRMRASRVRVGGIVENENFNSFRTAGSFRSLGHLALRKFIPGSSC